MSSEIKLTPKSLFGYALFILGLVLLAYVSMNAIFLATGIFQPLTLQIEPMRGEILSIETQVFLGIVVQIGMYALLIVVGSILMKYGLTIARKE